MPVGNALRGVPLAMRNATEGVPYNLPPLASRNATEGVPYRFSDQPLQSNYSGGVAAACRRKRATTSSSSVAPPQPRANQSPHRA
jgi:hypothetical protein